MPGVESEVSAHEFFTTLAGYVSDIANESESLGFCFSYPCQMSPNKDGKLTFFAKEIKAPEVIGQMIGAGLNDAFAGFGISQKRVVILNDTVTTLLAGVADSRGKSYDGCIGFIVGTGTNICYIEQNSNITKANGLDPNASMVINVESGNFDKTPRGKIDIAFDAELGNPGKYTFEKMVAGAYLGPLAWATIEAAVKSGVFSSFCEEKLKKLEWLTTKDISDYLAEPTAPAHPLGEALASAANYDKANCHALVADIVNRAAKLIAACVSAVVLKADVGKDPARPVCLVAEGTTFYHLPGLKDAAIKFLDEFLVGQKKRYYEIIEVENATLIGAAIAGLTN